MGLLSLQRDIEAQFSPFCSHGTLGHHRKTLWASQGILWASQDTLWASQGILRVSQGKTAMGITG